MPSSESPALHSLCFAAQPISQQAYDNEKHLTSPFITVSCCSPSAYHKFVHMYRVHNASSRPAHNHIDIANVRSQQKTKPTSYPLANPAVLFAVETYHTYPAFHSCLYFQIRSHTPKLPFSTLHSAIYPTIHIAPIQMSAQHINPTRCVDQLQHTVLAPLATVDAVRCEEQSQAPLHRTPTGHSKLPFSTLHNTLCAD
jgi:hypothetical protein